MGGRRCASWSIDRNVLDFVLQFRFSFSFFLNYLFFICTHTAYSRRSRVPFMGTRMDEFSDQVNV